MSMSPQTIVLDAPSALQHPPDQRQAQRHQASQSVNVSVIGAASQILRGEIRNISKGGTQLQLDRRLGVGALLRIEYDDNLLLGEVMYCQQEETAWMAGIRIEHTLTGLTALANAMA